MKIAHAKPGSGELYHGSRKIFHFFSAEPPPKDSKYQFRFGIHFTEDIGFASLYASPDGYVYRCWLEWKKIFDARKIFPGLKDRNRLQRIPGADILLAGIGAWMRGRSGDHVRFFENGISGNIIDAMGPAGLKAMLQNDGFDAVSYEAVYSSANRIYRRARSIVILDPGMAEILDVKPVKELLR